MAPWFPSRSRCFVAVSILIGHGLQMFTLLQANYFFNSGSIQQEPHATHSGKAPNDDERQAKWRYMQELEANNTTEWRQLRQWEIKQGVQGIYYINLDKNVDRRTQMEDALQKVEPPIPYYRFAALTGTLNGSHCVTGKQESARCRGMSGLSDTNCRLMETQNMSGGLTLVLEDDYVLAPNRTVWEAAIRLVPDDNWDVIRFLLTGTNRLFRRIPPRAGMAPWDSDKPQSRLPVYRYTRPPTFVQGSRLHKLHRLWSRRPYEDIDCALSTADPPFRSYVVGRAGDRFSIKHLGYVHSPFNESTDIPK